MSQLPATPCPGVLAPRAARVRASALNGIDLIEVRRDRAGHATRVVDVWLFHPAPARIVPANVRISGGVRVTAPKVRALRIGHPGGAVGDADLQLELDRSGDLSDYQLELVEIDAAGVPLDQPLAGFDPWFAAAAFSFRPEGASAQDCQPCATDELPPPLPPAPDINYLAKDYAGFRQLILDRLAQTLPDWSETHVPDLGTTLVEVLAYVGDYLSYYQDAVGTEAYLGTARQRISVRRHLRLLDYRMHDGCNARTWALLECDDPAAVWQVDGDALMFLGGSEDLAPATLAALREGSLPRGLPADFEVFEPVHTTPVRLRGAHQAIAFHTWDGARRVLPPGTTRATLRDAWQADGAPARTLDLRPGDFLCFEQVRGPGSGAPMDADPLLRHVVRLREVRAAMDALCEPPQPLLEICWDVDDALPFAMVLSVIGDPPGCALLEDLWLARGNVVLADEGLRLAEEILGPVPLLAPEFVCLGDGQSRALPAAAAPFQPTLQQPGLISSSAPPPHAAACALLQQDPQQALPWLRLRSVPGCPDGSGPLFTLKELQQADALLARLKTPAAGRDWALRARLTPAARSALAACDHAVPLPPVLRARALEELAALVRSWRVVADLLASGPQDAHCVAECDDQGHVSLRFGDGTLGRAPEPGELFHAQYRIGLATASHLGAGALSQVLLRGDAALPGTLRVRNPLPAQGRVAPQSIADARLQGAGGPRGRIEAALDADDYAVLATAHPGVQRAAAALAWTGSREEVRVAIDPLGSEHASPELLGAIQRALDARRRIGHEVVVVGARYVPLDLRLQVDLAAGHARAQVERAVRQVLGAGPAAGALPGLFHPDRLSFGQAIEAGRIQAALLALPGVAAVQVRRLARLFGSPEQAMVDGVLAIGPMEIAQLDNLPGQPERGRLRIELRGSA